MLKCKECQIEYKNLSTLNKHIYKCHEVKKYYDKFIKKEKNICKYCNEKETIFINLKQGYKECCCKKHTDLLAYEKRKIHMLKTLGVENVFQLKNTKEKSKQTLLKKYGVEHQMYSVKIKNKIKENYLKNTGVEHQFCKNHPSRIAWEKRLFDNEGIVNVFQRKTVKEKCIQTHINNLGCENPMQNPEIFLKSFKTRIKIHKYKNTNLYYQASYEKEFLDLYSNKFIPDVDLFNGPCIQYYINDIKHIYHSDFYIKPLNLIIEIKSTRTLEQQSINEIEAKKEYTQLKGYNFVMILEKNYEEFNKWLK
jgi:hypothetical protein